MEGRESASTRYLLDEIRRVRAMIDRVGSEVTMEPVPPTDVSPELATLAPTIVRLCVMFELTPFERDVILAAAGTELDPTFAACCGAKLGGDGARRPTLGLALAAFGHGRLEVLSSTSKLRRLRLIDVDDGPPSLAAPFAVDDRILHFLLGVPMLDQHLVAFVREVEPPLYDVASVHPGAVAAGAASCSQATSIVLAVSGATLDERRAVAHAICSRLGRSLFRVRGGDVPSDAPGRVSFQASWEREALLSNAALLVELEDDAAPDADRSISMLLDDSKALSFVSSREPISLARASYAHVGLSRDPLDARVMRWNAIFGPLVQGLDHIVEPAAAQFALSPTAIERTRISLASGSAPVRERFWEACREQARPRLDGLAQRIEPIASWNDLVLPADVMSAVRAISSQLRLRHRVYERWEFGTKTGRGLGTSALFAGPSGTGKTLAAEVLAREARLDLYQIDLSQIVNKYIGETEKNLRRVFDAAEESGAVLLFDEADALFGKRANVEKGTDRYANIEVSYLLQRMESYRGLAILTTNRRDSLDGAFLRRLRYVVTFPFPDAPQRMAMWERAFPKATPTSQIDVGKLAQLRVPGGNIRSIALNAAFIAAESNKAIGMGHLLVAARAEFLKIERPFPETEVADWVS